MSILRLGQDLLNQHNIDILEKRVWLQVQHMQACATFSVVQRCESSSCDREGKK